MKLRTGRAILLRSLEGISMNRRINALFCFFVIVGISLTFRSVEIIRNPYGISHDGKAYYNLAINLLNGNGYSVDTTEPYEPYFWREPAYPVFLAMALSVPKIMGFVPEYVTYDGVAYFLETHGQRHSFPMWGKAILKNRPSIARHI